MPSRTTQPSGFVSKAATLPSAITPTGSPMTIQNTDTVPSTIIVAGGTVSQIEFSRDGSTWFTSGLIAGMFSLSPSDRLKITYAVAPSTLVLVLR